MISNVAAMCIMSEVLYLIVLSKLTVDFMLCVFLFSGSFKSFLHTTQIVRCRLAYVRIDSRAHNGLDTHFSETGAFFKHCYNCRR